MSLVNILVISRVICSSSHCIITSRYETFSAVPHYLCLVVASLEEELLEPEELQRIQSRKSSAQAGLGYLGARQAGLLVVTEMGRYLLSWGARKPRDWGRPEVQKVLWVMGVWAQQ